MRRLSSRMRTGSASALGRVLYGGLFCGLMLGIEGCRHKVQLAPLPAIQAPVALLEIPRSANQPLLEVAPVRMPPTPIAAAATRPSRERRRNGQKPSPLVPANTPPVTPAQSADVGPSPETTAIGALTAGGEASPQTRQDAASLISTVEKRLNALPAQSSEDMKAQASKARNFWRDAQEALKSGDAEGAMTLATKAKLLLDDMEKE